MVRYFARQDGAGFEIAVDHLKFKPADSEDWFGANSQALQSINSILSTLSGGFSAWQSMIDRKQGPYGLWELSLSDTEGLETKCNSAKLKTSSFC